MPQKYKKGLKVALVIERKTPLGFVAIVNENDEGLLYHDEIFELLHPGQELPGYVKDIRADGRLDLVLQPLGIEGAEDLGKTILETLRNNKGFLAIDSKTPAEKIYDLFGVSKKKFKIALGGLYKKRLVTVEDDGIRLSSQSQGK